MEKITSFIKLLFFLCLFTNVARSQEFTIKGEVCNEEGISLAGAIVNIIFQKDSLYYGFARVNQAGLFSLNAPIQQERYYLVVTYPKHTDVFIPFEIDSTSKSIDFGQIKLPLNSIFLDEITIVAQNLMNVKGDTIEYNIGNLKLEPNARIEDIINQLPGMQITRGGQIFSHGKMIEKILVDGEPFFGNDPSLVTKNIRADIVEKIQVFDDKSEKEKITGIPDDNKQRTINVQLKEDKKRGMFGLAQLGYTNQFYNNILMLNRFNGKEKITGYGIYSNTGKIGVGYQQLGSTGKSLGQDFNSYTGKYSGLGQPKVYAGGLGYSNSWGNRKLNSHFNINGLQVTGSKQSYQQFDSDIRTTENISESIFSNRSNNQNFKLTYESTGASQWYIDLTADKSHSNNNNSKSSLLRSFSNESVLNKIIQLNENLADDYQSSFIVNWSQKIGGDKDRLSISINPKLSFSSLDGKINIDDEISQVNTSFFINANKSEHKINSDITYSKQISHGTLIFGYENNNYLSSNNTKIADEGQALVNKFSGDFNYNYLINVLKAYYRFGINKFSSQVGLSYSLDRFYMADIRQSSTIDKKFTFTQPRLNLEYKINSNHWLKAQYSKNIAYPGLRQVQPFSDYEDFINLYTGNKNIKPQITDRFYFDYYNFKLRKLRVYNNVLEMNLKKNAYGYNIVVNDNSNSVTPINIERMTYDLRLQSNFGVEINSKKDYFGLWLNANHETNYNYINGIENQLRYSYFKLLSTYSFKQRNRVRFNTSVGPTFENMKYSKNITYNHHGVGMEALATIRLFLPFKTYLEQDWSYTYKPINKLLNSSLDQLLWDISLVKTIGKENQFTISVEINDVLNSNSGFQRFYSSTGYTENKYSTIQRYFLFSAKWDLNKM